MDELFVFALGCFTLVLVVGTPVVVLLLFLKSRRLERRVEDLTIQFSALSKVRGGAPADAAAQAVVPPTPAAAAHEPPVPPAHEPEPEPATAAPRPEPLATPAQLYKATPAPEPRSAAKKKVAAKRPPSRPAWVTRARQVDWERWIGVRGAAVVGGAVLALAAILFFVHAFNEGWIKPPMRVAMGIGLGFACIGFGMRLRRKAYSFAPAALEGAGIVALYAAIWAADKRYHMLSMVASFPLMALITALACTLAIRHKALLTAVFGLVGGFATPLLLSTGSDRPIGLFGYILLLDLGLLFVGKKRGWSIIGFLALLGTFLIEGLWIFGRMGQERVGLGITIVGVFAVLFAIVGRWIPEEQRKRWMPAQAGGVIFPFVFAFYFSNQLEFRGHVWPNALLIGLLVIAACLVGRMHKAQFLGFGGASAGVAVVAVWLFQTKVTTEVCWELSAVALGLALVSHAFAEWERRRDGAAGILSNAAFVSALGWSVLLIAACVLGEKAPLHSVLLGLLGLGALLVRQAVLTGRSLLVLAASAVVGLGLGFKYATRALDYDIDARLFALIALVLVAGLVVLSLRVRAAERLSWLSAWLLVAPFLLALPMRHVDEPLESWFVPLTVLVLILPVLGLAARAASSPGFAAGALLAFLIQFAWRLDFLDGSRADGPLTVGFLLVFFSAAVTVLWPALRLDRYRGRSVAFIVAAVVAILWSLALAPLYEQRFGDDLELAPYFGLALLGAGAGWRVLGRLGKEPGGRALAWLGGAVAFLAALGLALQFEHEELPVTLALWSLGLAAVARWLRRTGPGWVAGVAALTATLSIASSALDSGHYVRSEAVLFHAITYAHLVPALALVGVTLLLRDVLPDSKAPRRLRWFYAATPGLGVIVIVFAWINMLILNYYGEQARIRPELDGSQARDLSMSIAWGLYALGLLGFGTARHVMALRWASLALFFLTIGKVFLLDLGDLEGLYRVGSLAGLAVSLIAVSLFYQRFVFRKSLAKAAAAPAK